MKYLDDEYKKKISTIYETPDFYEDSGVSRDELKALIYSTYEKYKDASVAVMRSHLLEVFLDNCRFAIRDDLYADRFDHYTRCVDKGSFLLEIRAKYYYAVCDENPDPSVNDYRKGCWFSSGVDFGHQSFDWQSLLRLGATGLKERAEKLLKQNPTKSEFYECEIRVLRAVIRLISRMAAFSKNDETPRGKLLHSSLSALSVGAPGTLHQALTLALLFYRLGCDVENHYIRSLGNFDTLYEPFFNADMTSGAFTEEELDDFIAAFMLRCEAMKLGANVPMTVGGTLPDGSSAFTDFTARLIRIHSSLSLISPKMQIKYNETMPDSLAEQVCAQIIKGNSSYLFVSDSTVRKALERSGISEEDARDFSIIGCYEPIATRTQSCTTCNSYFSAPKSLEYALTNGYDYALGKQVADDFTPLDKITSYDELFAEFLRRVGDGLERDMRNIVFFERAYNRITASPLLTSTCGVAMEKGVDIFYGGMKYNDSGINFTGLATAADSLLAIRKFVFDEHKYTLGEFVDILRSDWKDAELLRLKCKNYRKKYANADPEADETAKSIIEYAASVVNGKPNGRGGKFRLGFFSVDAYMWLAPSLMASADGRKAGDFFSKNNTASIGCDYEGTAGLIKSANKLDYTLTPNGSVLDFMVHPSAVGGENGPKTLLALIRSHLNNGGFSVHGNVFDASELEKAQRDPDSYRNLQVRVCGWNAYFVTLSKREQDVFIRRAKGNE